MVLKINDKFDYIYYGLEKSKKTLTIISIDNINSKIILDKDYGSSPRVPFNSILYKELLNAKKSPNGKCEFKSLDSSKIEGIVIYHMPLNKKIKKLMQL